MKSYNRIVIETGDFEQLKSVILAYGGAYKFIQAIHKVDAEYFLVFEKEIEIPYPFDKS
jgi:hypothetical protein